MADEYTNELKFGEKILIPNINIEKDQFQVLHNINTVYVNGPSVDNASKSQLEIDPSTMKVKLGKTRIQKKVSGSTPAEVQQFNVWVKTSTSAQGSSGTGQNITSIVAGQGIKVDASTETAPVISIDKNVVMTKGSSSGQLSNSDAIYYDLIELLKVIDIIYSDTPQNQEITMQWSDNSNENKNIMAFSYRFDRGQTIDDYNYLRIKTNITDENAAQDVYCVIYECSNMKESGDGGYIPPQTIYQFLDYGTPLTVSKNPAKLVDGHYQWFFAKEFSMKHTNPYTIYLVTFVNKKVSSWNWADKTDINIITNKESSSESPLQLCWDRDFIAVKQSPYATFSKRKPIGAIIK